MSGDSADRADRGYRAASDMLDERPSAATRAAILAAAARHVQAGPRDAAAPKAVPRSAPRRRWPLAAAAAVMLSTLAVMMATRTEQEMPTFSPPASVSESGTRSAEPRPPDGAKLSASPPGIADPTKTKANADVNAVTTLEKEREAVAGKAPTPAAGGALRARDLAAPGTQEQDKVTAPAPNVGSRDGLAEHSLPTAPAPASPPAAVTPKKRDAKILSVPEAKNEAIEPSEAQRPQFESRRAQRADGASRAAAQTRQAPSPALGSGVQERGEADAAAREPLSAEDWLERIIRLRKAGRHDEADAELKRFRERYPQVRVPSDALAPSGTR
jgi:hypothetical protein